MPNLDLPIIVGPEDPRSRAASLAAASFATTSIEGEPADTTVVPVPVVTTQDVLQTSVLYAGLTRIQEGFAVQAEQISKLQATVLAQAEHLARLDAGIRCLPCPIGTQDPNVKEDKVASVAVCMENGQCTCDLGYVLETMPGLPEFTPAEPPVVYVPPDIVAEGEPMTASDAHAASS